MNSKNNNNFQKTLKVSCSTEIPENYTGIIEYWTGTKEWLVNGKRHKTDGPAVEWVNGDKRWFLNGKPHRTDGPAMENADGYKEWFFNGELHRVDGPAVEWADGNKEWWIHGIKTNPLFFEIPGCEKYVDYYLTILQTDLVEHEEFLLEELKKQVESKIKSKNNP